MNYKVIEGFISDGMTNFEGKCSKAISEGWVPAGGIVIVTGKDFGIIVAQAMWKPLDKEERDGRNL